MKIHLHKNATTTPAQRAFIQNNPHLTVAALAEKTGVSKTTIRRWQKRMDVYDRPHTPKRIKTALSPIEEIKITMCRMAFRAGLDDLNQIAENFFNIKCSRASLNRCLKRYEISKLPNLKSFVPFDLKDYTGTYFYYSCFHLPSFSESEPPVVLQCLLDCTFRTFHAQYSTAPSRFLLDYIQHFPLRVLGIIYSAPIILGDRHPDMASSQRSILQLCRTLGLTSSFIDNQHSQAEDKLNHTLQKMLKNSEKQDLTNIWKTNDDLFKQIHQYNFDLPLGFLKQKTPFKALESHYTHFPNSFKLKPEALAS